MVRTEYRACGCGARLLLARGVPPLNFMPDPAGRVAVTIDDPRRGRFLAAGEALRPLEHQHSVHACEAVADPEPGLRGEEWRKAARGAIAGLHRHQRAHRAGRRPQEITGAVVPPPELPLDGGR